MTVVSVVSMVSAVSFRSFRFDVSPFSTCPFKYVYTVLLFDYRTLLVYTLQLTFKVGVSSIFEFYWLMEYNGKANC